MKAASDGIVIDYAEELYAVEAYKRAAYVFMARATVDMETAGGRVRCVLRPAVGEDSAVVEADFRREVLDQDLRISTERSTEGVRNLILGLAFSRVGRDG